MTYFTVTVSWQGDSTESEWARCDNLKEAVRVLNATLKETCEILGNDDQCGAHLTVSLDEAECGDVTVVRHGYAHTLTKYRERRKENDPLYCDR